MEPYKVLIVDDSAFMRKIISDLVSEHPDFEVVGTAKNGAEALEKVKTLAPDVVTMDVEMPVMNGLEALGRIMAEHPTPVVMLSSRTSEGAMETICALERGAVDFVQKPSGSISLDLYKVKEQLLHKLEIAVKANVRGRRAKRVAESAAGRPTPARPGEAKRDPLPASRRMFRHLVAIGTSTGGPRALQAVLTRLPEHFPAPILVVQHMPPKFTKSLADRLNQFSQIQVREASDNEELLAGVAYIAPGGWHMTVQEKDGYRIRLSDAAPRAGHRPSADVLFESLLPFRKLKRHIVLMTGMGSDGAQGMKLLKDNGADTCIAESEESCTVFGMPRAAIALRCVDFVLPVDDIAAKLVQLTAEPGRA